MTSKKQYSFDPSWLVTAPPGPMVCNADVAYMTIDSDNHSFACLLCESPPLELTDSKMRQHCRSAKHYKRYGLLMRAYRVEHGILDSSHDDHGSGQHVEQHDDGHAESFKAMELPTTPAAATVTRRYPESWFQSELPKPFDYNKVPFCERTFDIHAKTLRWRCLLCDSGWMGNNDKDPLAHCQGSKHVKQYAKFKAAYLQRQEQEQQLRKEHDDERLRQEAELAKEQQRQQTEAAERERLRQEAAENERLRQQQLAMEKERLHQEAMEKERIRIHQETVEKERLRLRQQQQQQEEAARIKIQSEAEVYRRAKLEQPKAVVTTITTVQPAEQRSPPIIVAAPPAIMIEPHWLDHPLKGTLAYNGVPYGQIKMVSGEMAKWRCMLCQSGWMPADDPFPLRHCRGRAHATNYKLFEEAAIERQVQSTMATVKKTANGDGPVSSVSATHTTRQLPESSQAKAKAAGAIKTPIHGKAAGSIVSFDPFWLSAPLLGKDAYESVVYGEERTAANGKREWRCLMCDSNWMTANGKDQPRHTQGGKHVKNYQKLLQAYEEQIQKNGRGVPNTPPRPSGTPPKPTTPATLAQPFLDAARNKVPSSVRQVNPPNRPNGTATATNGQGCDSPSVSMAASVASSHVEIDERWLASPLLGSDAYENVLYGEAREQNGKLQWRCLLCDSNWMSANDKDRPRHTSGSKHRKNYAKLAKMPSLCNRSAPPAISVTVDSRHSQDIAPETLSPANPPQHNVDTVKEVPRRQASPEGTSTTFQDSWLSEPPKGQLAFENVPYGELRRDDKGKFLWKCLLCSSNWMVASDENRSQHCRGKQHAKNYKQLVEAFEDRQGDDSSNASDCDVGNSESHHSIPKTFEHTEQPRHQLEKRWGDFTSEAFTTADDTWLPVTTVDERQPGKLQCSTSAAAQRSARERDKNSLISFKPKEPPKFSRMDLCSQTKEASKVENDAACDATTSSRSVSSKPAATETRRDVSTGPSLKTLSKPNDSASSPISSTDTSSFGTPAEIGVSDSKITAFEDLSDGSDMVHKSTGGARVSAARLDHDSTAHLPMKHASAGEYAATAWGAILSAETSMPSIKPVWTSRYSVLGGSDSIAVQSRCFKQVVSTPSRLRSPMSCQMVLTEAESENTKRLDPLLVLLQWDAGGKVLAAIKPDSHMSDSKGPSMFPCAVAINGRTMENDSSDKVAPASSDMEVGDRLSHPQLTAPCSSAMSAIDMSSSANLPRSDPLSVPSDLVVTSSVFLDEAICQDDDGERAHGGTCHKKCCPDPSCLIS